MVEYESGTASLLADEHQLNAFRDPSTRSMMCARFNFKCISAPNNELDPIFECLECNVRTIWPHKHICERYTKIHGLYC